MVMSRARREQILAKTLSVAYEYFKQHNVFSYLLEVAARFLMRGDYESMIDALHLFQTQNKLEGIESEILADLLVQAYELADGSPEEEELNEEYCSCECEPCTEE
jgi:hypothetical protein